MPYLKPLAFLLVGVILGVFAVAFVVPTARFVRRAATARGVVTRIEAGVRPAIRFTAGGQDVEYVQRGASGYVEGEPVVVLYDPADPRHACLDDKAALWFLPGLVAFLSLWFVALGAGTLRSVAG